MEKNSFTRFKYKTDTKMSMAIKSRKGMQTIEIIVFVVIALVVLFVVLWIFRNQIGGALSSYNLISNKTLETAEGIRCETILEDKSCQAGPDCLEGTKLVSPPSGKSWSDCTAVSGKPLCCETVI
jgi:hypothetical protein